MNIGKLLLGLRNCIAVVNYWLWWELLQFYDFVSKTESPKDRVVTETTIGWLAWHILALVLAPIAIPIKIIVVILKVLVLIASVRLAGG